MAKIRHIAIATQNEETTAKFYMDVFGLSQVGKIDIPAVSGYFLTDGEINVAILHFKNDQVAGTERGKEWTDIHHIGFQVDSLNRTTGDWHRGALADRSRVVTLLEQTARVYRAENNDSGYTAC